MSVMYETYKWVIGLRRHLVRPHHSGRHGASHGQVLEGPACAMIGGVKGTRGTQGAVGAEGTEGREDADRVTSSGGRGAPAGAGGTEVSAVVLDIGNVVLAWDPVAAVAGRVSLAQWEEFVLGAGFTELNARSDAGEPFEVIVRDLAAAHPERPDWVEILRTYRRHHTESLPGPVPGVPELIEDLLAQGVAVYALTNFDAGPFEAARRRFPVLDRFTGVVVSGRERLVKPDPAVFDLLGERFGLEAARTLFVDDCPDNTAAGAACGFRTHLFTGVGRLRAELCEHGLLPAPVD